MKAKCSMEFFFPDAGRADAAAKAVSHEGDVGNRSTVKITRNGASLVLDVEAQDVVALRATANAFLRALQVFEGVKEE